MDNSKFGLYCGLSLMFLVAIVVSEMFYRQPLFTKSLTVEPNLQSRASSGEINFWQFYTDFALASCLAVPIVIAFLMPEQRTRCFYYVSCFTLIMVVMNVTKLSYADPRPFWVGQNVIAYGCDSSFGNPSGHTESSTGVALYLWLDYIATYPEHAVWKKALLLLLAIGFGVSVAFSRLILGVHSIDQVVYGFLIGVWVSFTMQYCVRPLLDAHIDALT
jgi:undecaprenyl-diphosphatase